MPQHQATIHRLEGGREVELLWRESGDDLTQLRQQLESNFRDFEPDFGWECLIGQIDGEDEDIKQTL